MNCTEEPMIMDCAGERMLGILHRPDEHGDRGVLVVVGGPQYRVGSHRQFLFLARHLAATGVPTLRFDYRGMGDSEGEARSFEAIDADIGVAIDCLFERVPSLRSVIIWGLCDAASAALMYASKDPRVAGLVLLNPWVRTEETLAKTYLKHYYTSKLTDAGFWKRLLGGKISIGAVLGGFADTLRKACGGGSSDSAAGRPSGTMPGAATEVFTERMRKGFAEFGGQVLIILSGEDLTAAEFGDLVGGSTDWKDLLKRPTVQRVDVVEANHTFSRRVWRDEVADLTQKWMTAW